MKKANILKIASAFVLVAAMLIFCACGKDYSKLKLDVNSIGVNLISNCSFQVTPEAVPNADAAISQLKLDETKLAKNADGSFPDFSIPSALPLRKLLSLSKRLMPQQPRASAKARSKSGSITTPRHTRATARIRFPNLKTPLIRRTAIMFLSSSAMMRPLHRAFLMRRLMLH